MRRGLATMNSSADCHIVPHTPGPFLVDGFKLAGKFPDCRVFFLTHFHGDHYCGLRDDFRSGTIFCTSITKALIEKCFGVDPNHIQALELNKRTVIQGVGVTLFDANHCPGAVMVQFEVYSESAKSGATLRQTKTYLHTGDFRFHPRMEEWNLRRPVDKLFLDTTYCHPRHSFPSQEKAISDLIAHITASSAAVVNDVNSKGKLLVLLSAYNLGKERLLEAVAKHFKTKIYVEARKLDGKLACVYNDTDRQRLFTADQSSSWIHCCRMGFCGELWPFFRPNFQNLSQYLGSVNETLDSSDPFTHVLGVIPSGWASCSSWNKKNANMEQGCTATHLVPYSEHSNFAELLRMVRFVKPIKVHPTVFGSEKERLAIIGRMRNLVDRSANKRKFLKLMGSGINRKRKSDAEHPDFIRDDIQRAKTAELKNVRPSAWSEKIRSKNSHAVASSTSKNLSCSGASSSRCETGNGKLSLQSCWARMGFKRKMKSKDGGGNKGYEDGKRDEALAIDVIDLT